ncbi:hypothetical protein [Caballeronia sp. RCC_10]|uniref:hypothetical protein n=1 Tax=Caballeronia sp. RCC_10 TaxID=3239227 RepID=UPI0035238399
MSETLMGCIVAGTAVFIALPAIFKHYIRERQRDRILQSLREQTAVSRARTR